MKLIWNTTKPVEMRGRHKQADMRVLKGWWPTVPTKTFMPQWPASDWKEAMKRSCSYCGVKPGVVCKTPSGARAITGLHLERRGIASRNKKG